MVGFFTYSFTEPTNIDASHRIGYQILFGSGVGLGIQQPLMAIQTVLQGADMSVGVAVIAFAQTIGAAIFISIGQSVFNNKLLLELHKHASMIDPAAVVANGASGLIQFIESLYPQDVSEVLLAYNNALIQTFYISLVMSCLTVLGAIGMEWRSVKGRKTN